VTQVSIGHLSNFTRQATLHYIFCSSMQYAFTTGKDQWAKYWTCPAEHQKTAYKYVKSGMSKRASKEI